MMYWQAVRNASKRWSDHQHTVTAAAISFYALFAIGPLAILSLIAASQFIGAERARAAAESRLSHVLGPEGVKALASVFNQSENFSLSLTLTAIATTLMLIYGASYVFGLFRQALNRAFFGIEAKPESIRRSAMDAVISQAVAIGFVIGSAGLTSALLVSSVLLHWLQKDLVVWTGLPDGVWKWVALGGSFLVTVVIATVAFTFLPTRRPPAKTVAVAVLLSALLFELGKWLFTSYISHSVFASVYGPAGSLVALMIWIYYSSRALLFAVELSVSINESAA